jgi:hypothetical protein
MRCGSWLVLLTLCACSGTGSGPKPPVRVGGVQSDGGASDTDHDGLCDTTEEQLGTDPRRADTDADGLPDLVEVGNGFDPTDPASPAADQLATLQGQPGAVIDFQVRLTVEGDGQGLSGVFSPISSVYADGITAETYLAGFQAISADPIDGVRSIDAASAHFASVLGRARLGFSLRFQYPKDGDPVRCARAYPFRYSVKSDDGRALAERLLVLVLVPDGRTSQDANYCLPGACQ